MSSRPFGGFPLIGSESRFDSDTCLLFVSARVKSGAFRPTCGAPREAGNHRDATKNEKIKNPRTRTPKAARTEAAIFDIRRRSVQNARRTPKNKSTAAMPNSSRLAQGQSRVTGQLTKRNG